jgi:hypothetical protein
MPFSISGLLSSRETDISQRALAQGIKLITSAHGQISGQKSDNTISSLSINSSMHDFFYNRTVISPQPILLTHIHISLVSVREVNFVLFNSILKYVINRLMCAFLHIMTCHPSTDSDPRTKALGMITVLRRPFPNDNWQLGGSDVMGLTRGLITCYQSFAPISAYRMISLWHFQCLRMGIIDVITYKYSDNTLSSLSWAPWHHFRPTVNCRLEKVAVQRGKILWCFHNNIYIYIDKNLVRKNFWNFCNNCL